MPYYSLSIDLEYSFIFQYSEGNVQRGSIGPNLRSSQLEPQLNKSNFCISSLLKAFFFSPIEFLIVSFIQNCFKFLLMENSIQQSTIRKNFVLVTVLMGSYITLEKEWYQRSFVACPYPSLHRLSSSSIE